MFFQCDAEPTKAQNGRRSSEDLNLALTTITYKYNPSTLPTAEDRPEKEAKTLYKA